MWFFKKKAKGHNFSDEERELAAEKRKQNRDLKEIEFQISKAKLERQLLENQIKVSELESQFEDEEEETGFMGLDEDTMNFINIVTKGQFSQAFSQAGKEETPPPEEIKTTTMEPPKSKLLSSLPAPFLNQLKKIPKEELHAAIEEL